MFMRLLATLLCLPLLVLPSKAQVLTASNVQIEWKVVNRFRLFADPQDFRAHENAWRQYLIHVDGRNLSAEEEARYIATTSVIGSEHVLNDRYIPFTRILRTQYNPQGWASTQFERLCYDSKERKHSACGGVENYVVPKSHAIEAALKPQETGLLFAEYNCEWRIDQQASITAPCDEKVLLNVPYPGGGTIYVNAVGEQPISMVVQVKDLLIAGLGDSFASGEGNPDVPAVMSADQRWRNVFPRRAQNDAGGNARWVDELCHRSLYSYQLRAALQIAIENPQAAVTFLGYSCSGASIDEGLLGPQTHMDYISRRVGDGSTIRSVRGGSRDTQLYWLLRDICKERPREDDGFVVCPGNAFRRNVDLVLLSVGGNDIGFSQLVTWATLRSSATSKIARLVGATVSPREFARGMKDTLPGNYARLAKALELAVPLRLEGEVFDSSRVVLSAYPDILEDENGAVCAAGEEGEDEYRYAANQSLNGFSDWLVVTPRRLRSAHGELAALHTRMGELAEDHGWAFAGKAYESRAFQGHGFCARNSKAGDDPAEQLVLPCWSEPGSNPARCETSWAGGERQWQPFDPVTQNFPYALRQRWVRSFNDAYLHVNTKVIAENGQVDEAASRSVFAETVGAMHPSAEGHAAMADAILLDIRQRIAELLGPKNE